MKIRTCGRTSLFNMICAKDDKHFKCTLWSDVIHLRGAEAIAKYEQDYYAGSPAVTRNQFGKGTAFYAGTVPDGNGMDWLIEQVCNTAGIKPVALNTPAGVELVYRANGNSSWLFVLNHSGENVKVPLEQHGMTCSQAGR